MRTPAVYTSCTPLGTFSFQILTVVCILSVLETARPRRVDRHGRRPDMASCRVQTPRPAGRGFGRTASRAPRKRPDDAPRKASRPARAGDGAVCRWRRADTKRGHQHNDYTLRGCRKPVPSMARTRSRGPTRRLLGTRRCQPLTGCGPAACRPRRPAAPRPARPCRWPRSARGPAP